ncbi:MAG: XdhC family protein [Deltaproteobacteria bacterium]|nr:XdhC family protein [Deltaproteobacteria bacterium]
MRDIVGDLERWLAAGEKIALVTLVRTQGSTPRLPGARLAVTRSGKMAGSISGGCVENDLYERALHVLDSGQPALASYGIADDGELGVGLSCSSTIEVLIEPFAAAAAWQVLRCELADERPVAIAIALSPPALLGHTLVVRGDGATSGAIAAELDHQLVAEAQRLLGHGGTNVVACAWQAGQAEIFIEAFAPPRRLFIVGAAHTAMPLCRLAKILGFRVSVIDARAAYLTLERFPEADDLQRAWPHEALARVGLDDNSYVVILTHDPKFDVPALACALRSQARYIGIMGSRRTHAQRLAPLREEGFNDAELGRIRAPIGLDLGARTPAEIAVAVLAEMLAVSHKRDGCALAARTGAVHATH